MATVTSKDLARYQTSLDQIAAQPKAKLRELLERLDWEDVTADANKAVEIMRAVCQVGTDLSAVSSANFYQFVRRLSLHEEFTALAMSGFDPAATEGAVRYFVTSVLKDDQAMFVSKCLDRYDYEVRLAARKCTQANANRDTAMAGYALVPEPGACEFCEYLASLGFIENWTDGDVEIHEHCRCTTVPGFEGKTEIEGYEPSEIEVTDGELYDDIPF